MKHVILGWGSLIWDPGAYRLKLTGPWDPGGPRVPLEFSRISGSRDDALTLVIDPVSGAECPTWYAEADRSEIEDAICDLRCREGTILKRIGFVDLVKGSQRANAHPPIADRIRRWAEELGVHSVIWTDLSSNFAEKKKVPFTIAAAVKHLRDLNNVGARKAKEYVTRAPQEVQTPLRRELEQYDWWTQYGAT